MKTLRLLFLALSSLIFITACKKHNNHPTDNNGLPPATQTGAHTLGFLLNGEPWVPQGSGSSPKLAASYDELYMGGTLTVSSHRFLANSVMQFFSFSLDSIQGTAIITKGHNDFGYHYADTQGCDYFSGDDLNWEGMLQISRLDKSKGIVSGNFSGLLIAPNCDTIRITEGRFDVLF